MNLIMNIVAMVVVAALAAFIAVVVNIVMNKSRLGSSVGKISFKESMDLLELPIVTFTQGNKKLNFLLDSGASYSVINKSALDSLDCTFTGEEGEILGIGGKIEGKIPYAEIVISYKDTKYTEDFQVVDMSSSFDTIEEDFKVQIHGILGNVFLQKNKYVLDFNELVAYEQK